MSFSVYSFLNAVFWFNIGLIPIALIQTHGRIVKRYSPVLLGALTVLAGIRVFLPLDATWFLVIDSRHVLRFLQRILNFQLFGIVPVWGLVVLIWLGGGAAVLIREATYLIRDKRIRSGWIHVQNDQVSRAASALNISPKQIIVSPQVGTPAVIGLFRPKIYLPDISLPHEEWIWILKHERQHIRHGDIWIKFLYLMLEAVCFWNPYMHRVANKLNELLEFRCDYLVTKHHPEAQTQVYLNSILHVLYYLDRRKGKLSGKQRSRMYSYMVYTQADLLLRNRFEAIQNRRPKRPLAHTAIAVGGIALFLASYLVLFQPAGEPAVEDIDGYLEITPENAYLIKTDKGTYEIWVNDAFFGVIPEDAVHDDPIDELPIYMEGNK